MAEKKDPQERFNNREKFRIEIRKRMVSAYNEGDVTRYRAFQEQLENDLAYEFKEQTNNQEYVKALTDNYFKTHGEKYTGKTEDLVEKDFQHWNIVEGSLGMMGKKVFDSYVNMDEETKNNNAIRWDNYIKTPPLGEGSRDFPKQIKGVGTGVLIDVGASLGLGTAANVAKSFLGKSTARGALTNALSSKSKVVGAGALYGTVADVERQTLEKGLGIRDEYDIGQTAASAVIGGASPIVGKLGGKALGKFGRPAMHWGQSAGNLMKTISGGYSATAAARGVARETGDVIDKYGADLDKGALNFKSNLQKGLNDIDAYYQNSFDSLEITGVNPIGIKNIFKRWNNTAGMKVPTAAKETIEKLNAKTITPIEALRELKATLYNAANPSKMAGKDPTSKSSKTTLYGFRKELQKIEENAANNVSKEMGDQYKILKNNFGAFENLQKTDIGKKLLAASQNENKAGDLIKSMVSGDFAWNNLRIYQKTLNAKGLKGTGQDQVAINLNRNIQKAVGGHLRGNDYKNLIKLMNNPKGLKTLKTIYPEDKEYWTSIMKLSKKLPKNKGGASSVVMNMAIARVGSNIGADLTRGAASAQLQQAGPIIGALSGISVVNKLVDAPFFQNAMIRAYKNKGGTMDTVTKSWLNKKGYSRTEIENIQDTLWGLTGTGYAMGSLDEIWEKYEDPIERKIEEIKAGYIW